MKNNKKVALQRKGGKKMLGANIKRARIRKGLTQAELAGEVGVTKAAIYYYETGMKTPSLATITTISRVLDVTIDELVKDI